MGPRKRQRRRRPGQREAEATRTTERRKREIGSDPRGADAPQTVLPPAHRLVRSEFGIPRPIGLAKAELRFNFSGTNWPDVLEWFAEQADLSLQMDQVPIGSFTFADPTRSYTVSEALDVINLALMKRGYSLVRRGRMLQVIDLEVENADKLISEIAELVTPDQLEERGNSDIVSCVFPLGQFDTGRRERRIGVDDRPLGTRRRARQRSPGQGHRDGQQVDCDSRLARRRPRWRIRT